MEVFLDKIAYSKRAQNPELEHGAIRRLQWFYGSRGEPRRGDSLEERAEELEEELRQMMEVSDNSRTGWRMSRLNVSTGYAQRR